MFPLREAKNPNKEVSAPHLQLILIEVLLSILYYYFIISTADLTASKCVKFYWYFQCNTFLQMQYIVDTISVQPEVYTTLGTPLKKNQLCNAKVSNIWNRMPFRTINKQNQFGFPICFSSYFVAQVGNENWKPHSKHLGMGCKIVFPTQVGKELACFFFWEKVGNWNSCSWLTHCALHKGLG